MEWIIAAWIRFTNWLFPAAVDPFDHDGDGTPGGSKPSNQRGLDALRREAEELGIKVDRRWGRTTLQNKISMLKD
jgi:hypothetical protein